MPEKKQTINDLLNDIELEEPKNQFTKIEDLQRQIHSISKKYSQQEIYDEIYDRLKKAMRNIDQNNSSKIITNPSINEFELTEQLFNKRIGNYNQIFGILPSLINNNTLQCIYNNYLKFFENKTYPKNIFEMSYIKMMNHLINNSSLEEINLKNDKHDYTTIAEKLGDNGLYHTLNLIGSFEDIGHKMQNGEINLTGSVKNFGSYMTNGHLCSNGNIQHLMFGALGGTFDIKNDIEWVGFYSQNIKGEITGNVIGIGNDTYNISVKINGDVHLINKLKQSKINVVGDISEISESDNCHIIVNGDIDTFDLTNSTLEIISDYKPEISQNYNTKIYWNDKLIN